MTILAKYIGPATVQISVSFNTGTDTVANFTPFLTLADAVEDAIKGTPVNTAGPASGVTFGKDTGVAPLYDNTLTPAVSSSGWELIEKGWVGLSGSSVALSTTQGLLPTTTFTQVYRSKCKDGLSWKTLIVRFKTDTQEIYVSTCESWNSTTHVAVNEAYSFFDCCPINYNLTACDIIIDATPRWCLVHSYICNESTRWAVVCETEREAFEDVAADGYPYTSSVGVPCWGVMNSVVPVLGVSNPATATVTSNSSNGALAGFGQTLWAVPKTKNGITGVNAACKWAADYGATSYPAFTTGLGVKPIFTYMGNLHNKFNTTLWDVSKRVLLPLKPIFDPVSIPLNYGTMQGIKIVGPVGSNMNKVSLTVDADGNASSSGTARDHWLLNLTGIPFSKNPGAYTASTVNMYNSQGTNFISKFVSVGNKTYFICPVGLYKIDLISRVETKIATLTSGQGLAFDGERYLYFGDSTQVKRLDTLDDTTIVNASVITGTKVGGIICLGDRVLVVNDVGAATVLQRFTKQGPSGTVTVPTAVTTPAVPAITAGANQDFSGCDSDGNAYFYSKATTTTNGRYNATLATPTVTQNYGTLTSVTNTSGNPGFVAQIMLGLDAVFKYAGGSTSTAALTGAGIARCSTGTAIGFTTSLESLGIIGNINTNAANQIIYVNGKIILLKVYGSTYGASAQGDHSVDISSAEITGGSIRHQSLNQTDVESINKAATASPGAQTVLYFDGARIYNNGADPATSSPNLYSYKIMDNINGGKTLGGIFGNGVNNAQVAIPA